MANWTTAQADVTIVHNLGRVPVGYFVIRTKKGGVVHDGSNNGTDWTGLNIVLQNTVTSDMSWIIVF